MTERTVRFLNLIDEYTRECLAIHVGRRINSGQVIDGLADAMIERGIPENIRSDNGPESTALKRRSVCRGAACKRTVLRSAASLKRALLRRTTCAARNSAKISLHAQYDETDLKCRFRAESPPNRTLIENGAISGWPLNQNSYFATPPEAKQATLLPNRLRRPWRGIPEGNTQC